MAFQTNQFVNVRFPVTAEEAVGYISSINAFQDFEISFLQDHKPGEMDILKSFGETQLRPATLPEIIKTKKAWEAKHGLPLTFAIVDRDETLFVSDHVELKLSVNDAKTLLKHLLNVGEHIAAGEPIQFLPGDNEKIDKILTDLHHQLGMFTMAEEMRR